MTQGVVVAGAGAAGLAAATEAARAGASVLLLEERSEPGGQLLYRVQPIAAASGAHAERPDRLARRLADKAREAGAELRTGALVAGCFPDTEVLVIEDGHASQIKPDALIVASGSTDLPYPFAGATFPGVFSARGLQILMNQHRVRPGRRFAVVGEGPDAEDLAVDIMLAGGELIWSGMAPAPFMRADGPDGTRGLQVGQEQHEVDVIAIAVGRQADPALAVMAGTPLAFSAELGGLVPVLGDRLQSTIPRLFVAGDAAGVGSVAAAIAEGRLAGIAAAAALGLASDEDVSKVLAAGGPELARRMAARNIVAACLRATGRMSRDAMQDRAQPATLASGATLKCRCEEILTEDILAAIGAGARTVDDVKRRTRAGMGVCQGIFCLPAIAAMVAQATGTTIDRVAPTTARPPVRPIALESLAALQNRQSDRDEMSASEDEG